MATVHELIVEYRTEANRPLDAHGCDKVKAIFEKLRDRGRELLERELALGLEKTSVSEEEKSEIRTYLLFMDFYTF